MVTQKSVLPLTGKKKNRRICRDAFSFDQAIAVAVIAAIGPSVMPGWKNGLSLGTQ